MIKAIIFDLDDTLLDDKKSIQEAFKATCNIATQKHAINLEQLEEKVRERARKLYTTYPTYNFTQKIGINPFEGLWGTFKDEGVDFQRLYQIAPDYQIAAWKEGLLDLNVDDDNLAQNLAKAFPKFRRQFPFVFDDTYHVLEQLKGKYQLILLTNGSPSLQKTKLEITPELKPYFDRIHISGQFGIGKPDPSIFQYVLEQDSLTKDEAIMVGDNLHTDVLGANRIGMKNIWINRNQHVPRDVYPTYEVEHLMEIIPLINSLS